MTATKTTTRKTPPRKTTTTTSAAPRKRLPQKTKAPAASTNMGDGWEFTRVAQVPDKAFLTGYVNRKIDGLTDFQIAEHALKHKQNILIEGPTGTGKTSFVYALAVHLNMPLYSLSSSAGSDPTQFRGRYIPDKNGTLRWQDGPFTDCMRYGGIILVNEINFLPDRVASDLFGALDKRRKMELVDKDGEVIYAPDDFLIVGDMNPGYSGTRELNAALRNRFAIQVEFDYDDAIEGKLVRMPNLLSVAKQFRAAIALGTYDTPVSTNMLMEFENVATELSLPFAIRNFIMHFPQEDRASVKEVFNAVESNLEDDLNTLLGKAPKVTSSPDTYDDEWDITDDSDILYTPDQLDGLTAADKRTLAHQSGIPDSIFKPMKVAELTQLLLGPAGGHPYWTGN